MYAVLFKNGNLLVEDLTMEEATKYTSIDQNLIIADQNSNKLEVWYTEIGGPWGYGHQEPSFITYGDIRTCVIRLNEWLKEETKVWEKLGGVSQYFCHCSCFLNGETKRKWFDKKIKKIIYG